MKKKARRVIRLLFLNQLINGLHIGSIYALIALGYTMVYGIVKLINFAHGDIIMVGAYVSLLLITNSGLPYYLAIPITMVFCAVLGVVIERLAYKPLRSAPRISALITAIGVSMFLQNLAQLIFSATPKPYPSTVISTRSLSLGGLTVNLLTLVTLGVAIVLMFGLSAFVRFTKTGKAMRAVSEDMGASQLMGINVNNTISITFAIGSALAAIGAVLYCMAYPLVSPTMGSLPGLKAFIAAVFGGIGILPGAMIGGFVMGIAESLTKSYISSQMSDAVVYGILIIMLLVKPTGLLGKRASEKV